MAPLEFLTFLNHRSIGYLMNLPTPKQASVSGNTHLSLVIPQFLVGVILTFNRGTSNSMHVALSQHHFAVPNARDLAVTGNCSDPRKVLPSLKLT